MNAAFSSNDWREQKIREWLLLMLRFAVTREPRDRSAVFAMADELDTLGVRWRPTAPRFFVTTTAEVCDAILGVSENANAVLRTYIVRIDDPRMRGAFAAAVDLQQQPVNCRRQPIEEPRQQNAAVDRREALDSWRGLLKK